MRLFGRQRHVRSMMHLCSSSCCATLLHLCALASMHCGPQAPLLACNIGCASAHLPTGCTFCLQTCCAPIAAANSVPALRPVLPANDSSGCQRQPMARLAALMRLLSRVTADKRPQLKALARACSCAAAWPICGFVAELLQRCNVNIMHALCYTCDAAITGALPAHLPPHTAPWMQMAASRVPAAECSRRCCQRARKQHRAHHQQK